MATPREKKNREVQNKGVSIEVKNRIFYLMSGNPHLPYLLCSLKTLREHYDGEIIVFAWEESFPIVEQIAADSRLQIEARLREPAHPGPNKKIEIPVKNAQFMDKMQAAMEQKGETDCVLYLDADTTIHGSLQPLLDAGYNYGFAATRFNHWTSHHGIPSRRIERLRKYKKIDQELVEACLDKSAKIPSVNGGIWACHPDSPILPLWYAWTYLVVDQFIADEIVLHLMAPKFRGTNEYTIFGIRGEYNCSPKFQPNNLRDDDVIIRHFHGDSNCRPDKSPKGYDLWRPIYAECLSNNIGNIQHWISCIENKWMKKLEGKI